MVGGIFSSSLVADEWVVAGPEIARLISEFEDEYSALADNRHHEQSPATQKTFIKQVSALYAVFEEMRNPFVEESMDLFTIDTKVIMSSDVVETVQNIQRVGEEKYRDFVKKRFEGSTPITDSTSKK